MMIVKKNQQKVSHFFHITSDVRGQMTETRKQKKKTENKA